MISPPFLLYITTISMPESELTQDFLVRPGERKNIYTILFDNFVEILK